MKQIRLVRWAMSTILLLSFLLTPLAHSLPAAAQSEAQPPVDPRFVWNDELESLDPREIPNQLSRPLPGGIQAADAAGLPMPPAEFSFRFDRYPTSVETIAFLRELNRAYPRLMQLETVGRSSQNRSIMAVRVGYELGNPIEARPALYLDGQHHAREAVSAQVVLYTIWYLVSQYGTDPLVTHLLNTRAVYAIPSVNPDGNDIFLRDDQWTRKTANPTVSDDDSDGQFDEDPSENAGYGTFDQYRTAFDAAWIQAYPDNPFVGSWSAHRTEPLTYVGVVDANGNLVPQTDNDLDGRVNEDQAGGTDPNRNYASHWDVASDDPTSGGYRGPVPFSEAETQAVRDYVLRHGTIAAGISYHSGADLLLHPWIWSTTQELPDAAWYETLSRKASELTEQQGFQGTPHTWAARGLYPAGGTTMDWLYDQGILAWTPEIYGASVNAGVERVGETNAYLLNRSGGVAFNPDITEMPATLARWLDWNLYVLAALPNVGISAITGTEHDITIEIANDGYVAVDATVSLSSNGQTYTRVFPHLSASSESWTIDLGPRTDWVDFDVAVTAELQIAHGSRPPQTIALSGQIHRLGSIRGISNAFYEPFVDLAPYFGGWTADAATWDTPTYHYGDGLATLDATAAFSATPQSGNVPLEVVFNNLSTGNWLHTTWDFGDGTTSTEENPTHTYLAAGAYDVSLTLEGFGETVTHTMPQLISVNPSDLASDRYQFFAMLRGTGIRGVTYRNEDIVVYDQLTDTWQMYFDGSDLGLAPIYLDAFAIVADGIYFSVNAPIQLPTVGTVDDSDILFFSPTSLGSTTTGTLTMVLDGSTFGLTTNSEDIDALDILADGRFLISTLGTATVGSLYSRDEDMVALNTSTGAWELYFDGSDIGLDTVYEDIWGVSSDPVTQHLSLVIYDTYTVGDLTATRLDLLSCIPVSLGGNTQCLLSVALEGATTGLTTELITGHDSASDLSLELLAAHVETDPEEQDEADPNSTEPEIVDDEVDSYQLFIPMIE